MIISYSILILTELSGFPVLGTVMLSTPLSSFCLNTLSVRVRKVDTASHRAYTALPVYVVVVVLPGVLILVDGYAESALNKRNIYSSLLIPGSSVLDNILVFIILTSILKVSQKRLLFIYHIGEKSSSMLLKSPKPVLNMSLYAIERN